jgi:hypothetical protein
MIGGHLPWYPINSALWRARLAWSTLSRPRAGWLGPAQIQAWLEFYVEEERQGQSFGSELFAKMLCAHGAPDCGNPLANDQENYFLLHPGGFIAGEIDRCLRPAQNELDIRRGEHALDRLGLLAHVDCPMLSAKAYWQDDDIRFAMALSALEGRWEYFGARAARVIVQSMRHGLLEPQVAPGLLVARRLAEEARHAPFWKALLAPRAAAPVGPPAPELDVGAWRFERNARTAGQLPAPQQSEKTQNNDAQSLPGHTS